MRRTALVVLFLLLAAVVSPALAQQAASVALASSSDVGADFDNDGFADWRSASQARTRTLGRSMSCTGPGVG